MKGYSLTTLLILLEFAPLLARGDDRIQLKLPNPDLKPGQLIGLTTRLYQETHRTNEFGGESSFTNLSAFFELKGRINILEWNESERTSKMDITLEHFLQGDAARTNSVLRAGNHLLFTYFAGESFFKVSEGYLPAELHRILRTLMQLTPGGKGDSADSQLMKLDQPRGVGETWEADPDKVLGLITPLYGVIETNRIESKVSFESVTNISGISCFQLQFRASATTDNPPRVPVVARGLMEKSRAQIEIRGTNICPISGSLPRVWASIYSIDGESDVNSSGRKGVIRVHYMQGQSMMLMPPESSED